MIFDSLLKANQTFGLDYEQIVNKNLDYFEYNDTTSFGYKLLHDVAVPYDTAVGDKIGLFPINYLNRLSKQSYQNNQRTLEMIGRFSDEDADRKIIEKVAETYIMNWPRSLPDGTITRDHGWGKEVDHNASFVWADDQFMGLTLIARIARSMNNLTYALAAGKQAILFNKHLNDPTDNLIFHGANVYDGKSHVSCCKWGRANGWGMLSHVEVLQALHSYSSNIEARNMFNMVLKLFQNHAKALLNFQSKDGRWHQVSTSSNLYIIHLYCNTNGRKQLISAKRTSLRHLFTRPFNFNDTCIKYFRI